MTTPTGLVRCPDNPVLADDGRPLDGCGRTFIAGDCAEDIHYDDGFVTCPHCGMWFDPSHAENQPQPQEV